MDALHKALEIDPNTPNVWNNIGSALDDMGDHDGAIEAYQKELIKNPKAFIALNNIGYALMKKEDHDGAIEMYRKALSFNSKYVLAWNNIGYSLNKKGDHDGAIEMYRKALSIDPNHKLTLQNLGWALKEKGLPWDYTGEGAKKLLDRFDTEERERTEREERDRKERGELERVTTGLLNASRIYESIPMQTIATKTSTDLERVTEIVEQLILSRGINARIKGGDIIFTVQATPIVSQPLKELPLENVMSFSPINIKVLRGGDWEVSGGRSTFRFKVKVENCSPVMIADVNVVLGSVPAGLELSSSNVTRYPRMVSHEIVSPEFTLAATKNCVGSKINALVTFTDSWGNPHTINAEPFEIKYVCNLLVPVVISKKQYNEQVEFMGSIKHIELESTLPLAELQQIISREVGRCFSVLQENVAMAQETTFRKLEGFAQGLYDKQEVALSVAMKQAESGVSKVVVKVMSDREEKLADILKDLDE
nr:tetratricopeptide repeat protein [Candidatus Sigynarchaeota archaeon]